MRADFVNTSSRRERNAYLQLPLRLSKNDSSWTPIPQSSVAFDLSSRHPYYEHSEAAFITVGEPLAPLGRIAVLNNRNFNLFHKKTWSFFTHFECIDDPDAATALMRAASAWARKRRLSRLVGPVGFLQTDARGMMISGHESMSSFVMPYSPLYYAPLMQLCGFKKLSDYLGGELPQTFRMSEGVEKVAQRVAQRSTIRLRNTSSRLVLKRMAPELLEIYTDSGSDSSLYYPLTASEKECIIQQLSQAVCPQLIHWLEDEGNACGMHMAMPNFNTALGRTGANRLLRMAAILRQRRHPREINISMSYLKRKYQGRGLNFILYAACQNSALNLGCRRALAGPVHESNVPALRVLKKTGVVFDVVHRLYQKEIL